MVLIGVDVHAAMFLEVNKPQPGVLFELVKGWLTGSTPELGTCITCASSATATRRERRKRANPIR
jgi:hypothetical protein